MSLEKTLRCRTSRLSLAVEVRLTVDAAVNAYSAVEQVYVEAPVEEVVTTPARDRVVALPALELVVAVVAN